MESFSLQNSQAALTDTDLIRESPNTISVQRCLDANLVNFIVVIVYFLLEFQINHVKIPLVFAEMGILPFPLDFLTWCCFWQIKSSSNGLKAKHGGVLSAKQAWLNGAGFQKFFIMGRKKILPDRLTSIPPCLDFSMIFCLLWSASGFTKISSIPVNEERQSTRNDLSWGRIKELKNRLVSGILRAKSWKRKSQFKIQSPNKIKLTDGLTGKKKLSVFLREKALAVKKAKQHQLN